MAERIELIERDFEEEDLPEGFDFAFLGNIVHGVSPDGNRELFAKLSRATTDIGTVAILDQFSGTPTTDANPGNPTSFAEGFPALLGYNLFLFSGGRSYEFENVKTWLAEAGFADVSYLPLPEAPGFSLVVAQKPT
jgi:hypothetical protein